jgi:glycosyltransferase involved in cell wall biosynthesis
MTLVTPPQRVAVVHDWLVDFAGAERVLAEILALYPQATLYTLIDKLPAEHQARLPRARTVTSWLQGLPRVERYFTRCLPLMPLAVQQFDLSGHDLIISSSHCVAKGVITPPDALHLCYCHSPMRYAWDMQAEYLRTESLSRGVKGWLARRMFHRLRAWDATSSNGVDHFAANSNFVQGRILKAYRRTSTVIHPPVDVEGPTSPKSGSLERESGHFVSLGRLMGYKNVALMVEAFRQLPQFKLTVAGDGPQRASLERRAPENVRFVGAVSEAEKWRLLRSASAFVFAAVEDFGIAPVEALAAGTPVVAFNRGGVLDHLRHGHNAWLFDEASPTALANALVAADARWRAEAPRGCSVSVANLGPARFRARLQAWVNEHWSAWAASAPGGEEEP